MVFETIKGLAIRATIRFLYKNLKEKIKIRRFVLGIRCFFSTRARSIVCCGEVLEELLLERINFAIKDHEIDITTCDTDVTFNIDAAEKRYEEFLELEALLVESKDEYLRNSYAKGTHGKIRKALLNRGLPTTRVKNVKS